MYIRSKEKKDRSFASINPNKNDERNLINNVTELTSNSDKKFKHSSSSFVFDSIDFPLTRTLESIDKNIEMLSFLPDKLSCWQIKRD